MLELLMQQLWNTAVSTTGSTVLTCLIFMVFVAGILIFFGLEFDFALLLTAPIPYALYKTGYLDAWISGLFIIFVIGFSIYMIWEKWKNKI